MMHSKNAGVARWGVRSLLELHCGRVGVAIDRQAEHPQYGRKRCDAVQPPLHTAWRLLSAMAECMCRVQMT